MAERTLRRKLVAEGMIVQLQVLEWVRRDICHLYFLEGKRRYQTFPNLGYSELSAFHPSIYRWYGHPPSKDLASQTACRLNRSANFYLKMVGVERVELPTPSMSTKCSTTELYAHAGRPCSQTDIGVQDQTAPQF